MTFGLISRRPALKPRSTPSASTSKARCKTPDDLDAPPLDSEDDESESQIVSKSGNAAHISDPDSSDGATSSRHDIKKTVFSKTKRGLPSRNAKVSRDRQGAGTSKRRHEDEDKTSGGTSAKRRSMSPSKDGVDEFLRNRKEDERRVTNKKGYGKESKNLPGLQWSLHFRSRYGLTCRRAVPSAERQGKGRGKVQASGEQVNFD